MVAAQIKSMWVLFLFSLAFAVLLMISLSDLKYYIIPDEFVIALAAAGILFSLADVFSESHYFHSSLLSPLFGGLLGGGTLLAVGFFSSMVLKKEGMGFGDIKLFFAAGLFLGVKGILSVFFMMILSAGLFCVVLLAMKKLTLSSRIPFGPFICGAMAIYLCFFQYIHTFLNWYMSLFL